MSPTSAPNPPRPAEPGGRLVYSVSRLNREARVLLERGFGVVWVEGELSNLAIPSSGHWYFSLKDREAQLRCAMFRARNVSVGFVPKSGQQVLARGRVGLYEPRGEYQFVVEHLEEAGIGALRREFERLKAKLAEEGLCSLERKRPLPPCPRRIGVITSPTGAAIRDILHILARRFPPASVCIYPTPVQGSAAAAEIVEAIETASARDECDVLIIARGGGSIEDLWAFNAESVARAICACRIPIVSGIGHEVDFTIADLVADARAPTPSGAAELVTPDRNSYLSTMARTLERLRTGMRRELRALQERFEGAALRLKLAHPGVRLSQQAQRLDDLEQRLNGAMRAALHQEARRASDLTRRLVQHSPGLSVRELRLRHDALEHRLQRAIGDALARAAHRSGLAVRALHTVSPLATLDRGFCIVKRASDGAVVTESKAVRAGDEIEARFARGSLTARVLETKEE